LRFEAKGEAAKRSGESRATSENWHLEGKWVVPVRRRTNGARGEFVPGAKAHPLDLSSNGTAGDFAH
jgi:hypothetical protein